MPGCDQPHIGMGIECIDEREDSLSRHHERMSETGGDNNGDDLFGGGRDTGPATRCRGRRVLGADRCFAGTRACLSRQRSTNPVIDNPG